MEHIFYYVISEQIEGKNYAYAETIKGTENLVSHIKRLENVICVNAVKTRKEAEHIA